MTSTHHFGSLSFSFSLDDLLSLVLLGFLHIELSSLRLLLGCGRAPVNAGLMKGQLSPPAGGTREPYLPTCLASTAAVYSRLKLSSVMATSSRMMLKSFARSNSSLRISSETCRPESKTVRLGKGCRVLTCSHRDTCNAIVSPASMHCWLLRVFCSQCSHWQSPLHLCFQSTMKLP